MIVCKRARSALGHCGVTQKRFAELTGVSKDLISQRETGRQAPSDGARILYEMLFLAGRKMMGKEMEDALESCPVGSRSEARSIAIVVLSLVGLGHDEMVEKALLRSSPSEASV